MGYTGDKKREYDKQWMAKRRRSWIAIHGPCQHCDSFLALEVDHIDPKKKSMHPSAIWSRAKKIRERELKKCQVLCKKCHKKKTIAELTHPLKHGTRTGYTKGCRCDKCREAAVTAVQVWRKKNSPD